MEEKNKELVKIIDNTLDNFNRDISEVTKKKFLELRDDIKNEFFTIVVLGEFKRGKSTLVNALLGEEILPSDVIPTTATINALMWSEEKETIVLKSDGSTELGESTVEYLRNYTAEADFDINEIKYLKVGYPADILKNKIALVDTPGVSDINEHRVQVTYEFIPRADLVIFILDATAPLKKTEKQFIDEHIIKLGIDRVIFVANKFDNIDEEEEEDVIEEIEQRLRSAFKKENGESSFKDLSVIPFSAYNALEGLKFEDKDLIDQSGLNNLTKKIKGAISESEVAFEKIRRYKFRLVSLLDSLNRELNNKIVLSNSGVNELEMVLEKIDKMMEDEKLRKERVNSYIKREEEKILAMIKKSLDYFYSNLKEEINDLVDSYKGVDFKDYIEKHMVNLIKKNMKRWVNTYYVYIDTLLSKLEKEVAVGLATYFKTKVILSDNIGIENCEVNNNYLISIEAEDISSVTTQAGLISAGAAGVLTLIGGPILLPFVGMAAFPLLQKKMLESKLNEAKVMVKPQINEALNESINSLSNETIKYVLKKVDSTINRTEEAYNELFKEIKGKIENTIIDKSNEKENIHGNINYLKNKLINVEKLKEEVNTLI